MLQNIPEAFTRRARYTNMGHEVLFARFCSPLAPHASRYGHSGCHEILNQDTFLLPLCFLLYCVALLIFGWHMVPYRPSYIKLRFANTLHKHVCEKGRSCQALGGVMLWCEILRKTSGINGHGRLHSARNLGGALQVTASIGE